MKLLALETSTEACSVALSCDDELISCFQIDSQKHGELILPMCEIVLSEAGVSLAQLDAIACSVGPGSFTGIRIGISVAQTLAFSHDLPAIAVSSLAALAQFGHRKFQAPSVFTAINARMNQVYWGVYQVDVDSQIMQSVEDDQVLYPSDIVFPEFKTAIGVGAGFKDYQEILLPLVKDKVMMIDITALPHAKDVAIIGKHKFECDELLEPKVLLPNYIRNNVTE